MNWRPNPLSRPVQLGFALMAGAIWSHRVLLAEAGVPSRAIRQCASCHPAQAKPHPDTSMAHAMELPAECAILKGHALLTFQSGRYSYRIQRKGDESIYTVSDGQQTISASIGWAFGLGRAGQTYVFELNGTMYESRVSFFNEINGLDFTLGATKTVPRSLNEAAGRALSGDDARCFGCHATNALDGKKLMLDRMTPGVQCERCHGESIGHLRSVKGSARLQTEMKDFRKLSAEDMSNFCGQCHRTWEEIAGGGLVGLATVRFQPYRLTNSKCYDAGDARIRCSACHDPHQEVDHVAVDYDAKCNACHSGGKASARHCPRRSPGCVGCHMPKVELPGAHFQFTDHQIRVVERHASYPN